MIILFAMMNSLATRENALRGAIGPPDRAAWGVYVGDGKIGDWGRRTVAGANWTAASRQNVRAARVAVAADVGLPSGHRQPETNRASHAALQATPGSAVVTTSIRAGPPALIWQDPSCPSARDFLADASPPKESGKPLRRVDHPSRPVRAACRPSSDGPGQTPRSTVEQAGCTNSVRIRNAP